MELAGCSAPIGRPSSASGVVSTTQLVSSTSAFPLRRSRVKLHSKTHLHSSEFHSKLSKSAVHLRTARRPVLLRCNVEEVLTKEKVGERESGGHLNETSSSSNGSNGSSSEESGSSREWNQAWPEDADGKGGSFDWLAQWYPVGVLKHMDKRQPQAVTVLGRDLVLWWDGAGAQWQIFADVCPHRLAPLSEGRINEQGHLQCSYHGWSFAPSTGACTLIPQAPKDQLKVKDVKRACAKVYQSIQQQGMLWVYMDTSEGAEERAAANPPVFIPSLSDPDYVSDIFMSDVTYSYETLIENLLDPSHVPFAHHKLQGNRNSARPLDLKVEKFGKAGFYGGRDGSVQRFVAPCLSMLEFNLPSPPLPKGHPWALKLREFIVSKTAGAETSQRHIGTVFLCVPTVPGKSRVFASFPRNFAKAVHHWTPRWLAHQTNMVVLDSDMYLLHLMEREIEAEGGMANIEKLYYTPTKADTLVIAYRRWLKKFAGGIPDFGPKASDRLPPRGEKRALLDRHSLHVVNCTTCSGAERNLKAIELALQTLPVILVGLVAASNTSRLRGLSNFSIPLICVALISSLASKWLSSWIKKHFEYHGYNHALVK